MGVSSLIVVRPLIVADLTRFYSCTYTGLFAKSIPMAGACDGDGGSAALRLFANYFDHFPLYDRVTNNT